MSPDSVTTNKLPHSCGFLQETPASIFTPEDFGQEERLMIDMAEQFCRKEVLPLLSQIDHQEEGLMRLLISRAGALGFCGIDAPEEYGGLGLGKCLASRMLEFLSLNASFSVTIGISSGIGQVALALFGTELQKERYLRPLASGQQIGAYALSEPGSGSDALSMTTRAERDGDEWVLTGTKMWISNARWADTFIVMAKTGPDRVSAFVVERNSPGLTIEREEHKLGLKGSSTARVVLDRVRVPSENLIDQEGRGHLVALNSLNLGRYKLSSMSMGSAREAIRQASIYAQERKQFGEHICNFGLIEEKFASMAARFFAAESVIYRTGHLIDQAFDIKDLAADASEENRKAASRYAIECSICKVLSTEVQGAIIDEALQVFGGYGFSEEYPLARMYRDARVSRIYEGTNEINRIFIGSRILKGLSAGQLHPGKADSTPVGVLLNRATTELATSSDLSANQIVLGGVADLAILYFAEQSVRLRAERLGGIYLELAKQFDNISITQAAYAFQRAIGGSVQLNAANRVDMPSLARAVYETSGPL